MKEKKKITEHEFLFGICFFAGVVLITILAKDKVPENTLMNQSLSRDFLEQGWNRSGLLLQCLFNRGIILFLLVLLAYTSLRKFAFRIVTVWIGLGLGCLCKLFFVWYGLKGIGLLAVSMLPHYLLYWMAYGMLYWEMEKRRLRVVNSPVGIVLSIGVVITGIIMESYVNPILLRTYLQLFF